MLQYYKRGVWDPKILKCKSDGTDLDHAVLLVGWGVDGKKPYWTVKNSWSARWERTGISASCAARACGHQLAGHDERRPVRT